MLKKSAFLLFLLALSQTASAEHGIRILDAYYGRSGRACDATRVVEHQCDGHGHCQLVASNRLCGDPVKGKVKELVVNFSCGQGARSAQAPEGELLAIDCRRGAPPYSRDRGQRSGLYVLEAYYGAGRKYCDATGFFQQGCDGQRSCSLRVGNQMCGDPFRGKKKRVEIQYQCGGRYLEASFWENQRAILSCDR